MTEKVERKTGRWMRVEEEEAKEERAPKPYAYVPLPTGQPAKSSPVKGDGHMLERQGFLNGQLQGAITALTPVHVASGLVEMAEEIAPEKAKDWPMIKAFYRCRGERVIPASSLKGAVRAVLEAITFSCVSKATPETRVYKQFVECKFEPEDGKTELCPACRMFGAPGYMGQVRFSDAVQGEGGSEVRAIPALYGPGRWQRGRRFYRHGQPAEGKDVPVEVCPAGSRFRFECHFENLSPGELGLLLIALGQGEPPLYLKLGGGKPACLGSVRIEVESLTVRQVREAYLNYEAGAGEAAELEKYINVAQRAKTLLFQEGLEALSEVLRYGEERACPAQSY
ncbi:MAG: RAMP superfamily CRISPR-associated protein [Anaerolineae bacterium]